MVSESGLVAGTSIRAFGLIIGVPFVNAQMYETAKFFLDFINAIAFETQNVLNLFRMIPASNKRAWILSSEKAIFL
jgi:hypothetical protein